MPGGPLPGIVVRGSPWGHADETTSARMRAVWVGATPDRQKRWLLPLRDGLSGVGGQVTWRRWMRVWRLERVLYLVGVFAVMPFVGSSWCGRGDPLLVIRVGMRLI